MMSHGKTSMALCFISLCVLPFVFLSLFVSVCICLCPCPSVSISVSLSLYLALSLPLSRSVFLALSVSPSPYSHSCPLHRVAPLCLCLIICLSVCMSPSHNLSSMASRCFDRLNHHQFVAPNHFYSSVYISADDDHTSALEHNKNSHSNACIE